MDDNKSKSVLDNVPVRSEGFPLTEPYKGNKPNKPVVSSCPACGGPVYGDTSVPPGSKPEVIFSCDCRERMNKPLTTFVSSSMETK